MILEEKGNTCLLNMSFGPVVLIVLSVWFHLILITVQKMNKGNEKTDPILLHSVEEGQ